MATGFLDANNVPTLEIEILGIGQATKFTCLVDTGFTGFLSIPLLQALPLGLVLTATTTVTFANGATADRLVCLGNAIVDGVTKSGTILLEQQGGIAILGIDFLRKFGLKLVVCPTSGAVEVVLASAAFTTPAGQALVPTAVPAPTPSN